MSKIRILSDRVANQIAAGEVVERPAAVVKELLENALDAGATRIEIEFELGGRALIRVEDNGSGMSRDDCLLALERHATSKIAEAADLDRLASFGFRGEALPSIASVSRFTLQSRTADSDSATEVLVNGGKLIHVRDCGRPVGTSVEVAHLFHPVPARRKFLKSDATESGHIVQCVRLYALACPTAAFSLTADRKVVFRSPECSNLADRVAEIFGRQFGESLVEIDWKDSSFRISGLIGRPAVGRTTRNETITFVNGRPVDGGALHYALREGCGDSLPKGSFPPAIVFFECAPAAVDVNVHPAKKEVRFRQESLVREFISTSVRRRLAELASKTGFEAVGLVEEDPAAPLPMALPLSPLRRMPWTESTTLASLRSPAPEAPLSPAPVPSPAPATAAPWRLIGFAHGAYALFESPSGIVLLDRRAAHERIWYERLKEDFARGAVPCQRLLLPMPLEVDPIADAILNDRRLFLSEHGFELDNFGKGFFRIEAIPAWMEPADAEPFLRDILGALRDGRMSAANVDIARDELARLAARKAVRLPTNESQEAMRSVVVALFATQTPLTSPAGRPTFIELNHGELARRLQKS